MYLTASECAIGGDSHFPLTRPPIRTMGGLCYHPPIRPSLACLLPAFAICSQPSAGTERCSRSNDTKLTFHTQPTWTEFTEIRHVSDRQPDRRDERAPPSSPRTFLDGPSPCRVLEKRLARFILVKGAFTWWAGGIASGVGSERLAASFWTQ